MRWETPSFVEIKMDAEMGGYQDDVGDPPDMILFQKALIPVEHEGTDVQPIQAT
jgi:hypothetical protein